jgi:hypothetical protein
VIGRRGAAVAASCTLSAWLALAATGALALSPPAPAHGSPSPAPPSPASDRILAAGTNLNVVLDEEIDSRTASAGRLVKLHLEKALELGGITLAPAGAPGTLMIVGARKAVAPDRDGSLEIYLEPLPLPGHGNLPLRAVREYLTVEVTAGQASTNEATDLAKDIAIPGHAVYRAIRKGRDISLPAGSIVRARTDATIDATNPAAIAIVAPPPFVTNTDPIHSDFTPIPVFTFAPQLPKRPRPSSAPSAAPSSAPTGAPVASGA